MHRAHAGLAPQFKGSYAADEFAIHSGKIPLKSSQLKFIVAFVDELHKSVYCSENASFRKEFSKITPKASGQQQFFE